VKARNDHDAKAGDTVRIMETRPVAKTVHWRTVAVILRAR
jgi:ribosomal protein S17